MKDPIRQAPITSQPKSLFAELWRSPNTRLAAVRAGLAAKTKKSDAGTGGGNAMVTRIAKRSRVGGRSVRQRVAGAWRRVAGPWPAVDVRGWIEARVAPLRQRLPRRPNKTEKPTAEEAEEVTLHGLLSQWRRLGWGVVTVFIGGFVVWASFTRLDSAVIAHGVVGVETNRKTVQHLEGGIVKDILVGEGERVVAGQTLVRFDDTKARATLDLLRGQKAAALVLKARLEAERDGKREIDFPEDLMLRADDPQVTALMTAQTDAFEARRRTITQQQSILRERIEKYRREITGLRAQTRAGEDQLALLEEELFGAEALLAKGLIAKTRVLALKHRAAEIQGEIGENKAKIARAGESIGEIKLQLTLPTAKKQTQATGELQRVVARIADLDDRILAARDIMTRTEVRAPQSGVVLDLQFHTGGGVVRPGEKILDLVPDKDRLVVDLRVAPKDIDAVYEGMQARARLTAYSVRTTAPLEGQVTSVSADRVVNPATGVAYFTARMVPATGDTGLDLGKLSPGMQAEVFLVTAQRTVLDYMLEPVTRSFQRAGRES